MAQQRVFHPALTTALVLFAIASIANAGPDRSTTCKCPRSCETDPDRDEVPMVVPSAAKATWMMLGRYGWRRSRGSEWLTLYIDNDDAQLSVGSPSLDGHGATVQVCAVRKIKRGLSLRLMRQVHGFGGLYPLLRGRALKGPRSGRSISCCDALRIRVGRKGSQITILGKTYRRVKK